MDPISALSLSGNVVQFTQFAFQLVHGTVAIYLSASGASENARHLEGIHAELAEFSAKLTAWLSPEAAKADALPASRHGAGLLELTKACKEDCEKLLHILDRLRVQPGKKNRLWRSFQKAMLEVWKADDVSRLRERIGDTQRAMTLQLCAIASENIERQSAQLSEIAFERSTAPAVRQEKFDILIASILDLRHTVDLIKEKVAPTEPDQRAASLLDTAMLASDQKFDSEEIDNLTRRISVLSCTGSDFVREEAILSSIDFNKRPVRHESIPTAHQKTFEWVFNTSPSRGNVADDRFARWLESGRGVFWVTGKPGSGKSTLMKFIVDRLRQTRARAPLVSWAKSKRLVVASHFFWSAGSSMQRSQEGLLRTLLFDILAQVPELIPKLCAERWSKSKNSQYSQRPWTLTELRSLLQNVTNCQSLPAKFCIFVDGLDEYDGAKDTICQDMFSLAASEDIKLCISSRPWNVFEDHFGSNPARKLAVHTLTQNDIRIYAEDRLHQHPRWGLAVDPGNTYAAQLVGEITRRADGVFLWVFFVTRMLRDGLTNDDSISDLQRRLESIPTDLEQFFRHMLESVESFYHMKMAGTLQIALAAEEPLPTEIYAFHDMEYDDDRFAINLPVKVLSEDERKQLRKPVQRRLNGRCMGLLEVRHDVVEFLHRTVRDYFQTGPMMQFLREKSKKSFSANLSLLKAFVASAKCSHLSLTWMFMEKMRKSFILQDDNDWLCPITLDLPLEFARRVTVEESACCSVRDELLDDLGLSFETLADRQGFGSTGAENRSSRLYRYMLIQHGLGDYIATKLSDNPQYFAGEPPLWVAARLLACAALNHVTQPPSVTQGGYCLTRPVGMAVVKHLLEFGYEPNNSLFRERMRGYNHHLDSESTTWTELLTQLFRPVLTGDGLIHTGLIMRSSSAALTLVLKSGVMSLLVEHGANPDAMVRVLGWKQSPRQFPPKITACALYVLLPFMVTGFSQNSGSYLQDLRSMISRADFSKLRSSLFELPQLPSGMGLLYLSIRGRKMPPASPYDTREQRLGATVLCELARRDSCKLPWEELDKILEDTFSRNLVEEIRNAISSSRARTKCAGPSLESSTPAGNKRGADDGNVSETSEKRLRMSI